MVDPRFFKTAGPFSLGELAEICGGSLSEGDDASRSFADVAPLQLAGPHEISFVDNAKYRVLLADCGAGACIVHPDLATSAPAGMALILSEDPYRAYARVAAAFHPPVPLEPGVAANADVHPDAEIGEGCEIRSGAVVGRGARIGPRTLIGALTVVGENVVIGVDCRIDCQVTLSHCVVGDRVCIATGVRIGQPGFGFAVSTQGHLSIPQLGRVVVGDDVDIGANTTVDRGAGPDTVIGQGCRIDNLIQIGHNVVLGRGCVLVGQSGVSGSTQFGDFVMLGGQAGVAGHLSVGAGARIGGKAGVMRDVPMGATVMGTPAIPIKTFFRQQAILARMTSRRRGNENG